MNMRKQRLMGVALIAIAWLVLLDCNGGERPEDSDATAALLVGPLGLHMLFTKNYILHDSEAVEEWEDTRKEFQHAKKASN